MMQKVNLKRITALARHLPKFLVVCVICGIIFLGGSGKIFFGNGSFPQNCEQTVSVPLTLVFPQHSTIANLRFCTSIPIPNSDPNTTEHAENLYWSPSNPDSYTWFCIITVTSACSTKQFIRRYACSNMLEVPAQADYSINVKFYEGCSNCSAQLPNEARALFQYNQDYISAGRITANLQYMSTFILCY